MSSHSQISTTKAIEAIEQAIIIIIDSNTFRVYGISSAKPRVTVQPSRPA
jgi:hypothetical protein